MRLKVTSIIISINSLTSAVDNRNVKPIGNKIKTEKKSKSVKSSKHEKFNECKAGFFGCLY